MTWLVLACDHRLLLPEDYVEEGNLPTHEFCRKCGFTERVVGAA